MTKKSKNKSKRVRNQEKETNVNNWVPSAKQIQIIELLVNPDDKRPKIQKINEVGISSRTFYKWMKDSRFVDYTNSQINRYTNGELPDVWKALLMQCKRGNVNAIKLFFEMKELVPAVKVKQEVTGKDGGPVTVIGYHYLSDEELKNELMKYEK